MSHNVHPYSFRLGILRDWKSRWFSHSSYTQFLKEDTILREWLLKKLKTFFVESIEIERFPHEIHIIIRTARPGLLIGRGGEGIEALKKEVLEKVRSNNLQTILKNSANNKTKNPPISMRLSVEEVKRPETNAKIVAQMLAQDLEKRLPFRRIINQAIEKVMGSGTVYGVRIAFKGRLDGSEMGRREWLKQGRIPLHTLRADIDFARDTAHLPYGTIGIKVWIYKGEILEKNKDKQQNS
ncbi:30S ribosomal protein S3 [Patescibacteria group bacterium]